MSRLSRAMMSRFDDVAKGLAGGVSRREAMRRLGGLLGAAVGAVVASVGLGKARGAGPTGCQIRGRKIVARDLSRG